MKTKQYGKKKRIKNRVKLTIKQSGKTTRYRVNAADKSYDFAIFINKCFDIYF